MREATWDARVDQLLPGREVRQLAALFPAESPVDLALVLDLPWPVSSPQSASSAAAALPASGTTWGPGS